MEPIRLIRGLSYSDRNISVVSVSILSLYRILNLEMVSSEFRRKVNIRFQLHPELSEFFNQEEEETVNSFIALKRQLEWIAGRLALKTVIRGINGFDIVSLSAKPGGAPFIREYPDWSVSISHSNHLAIAAVSSNPSIRVGIDLEKIDKAFSTEFMNVAFSKRERQEYKNSSQPELLRRWTIKEAYLKYLELGFHESITNVEVLGGHIYYHNRRDDKILITTLQDNEPYVISMVNNY